MPISSPLYIVRPAEYMKEIREMDGCHARFPAVVVYVDGGVALRLKLGRGHPNAPAREDEELEGLIAASADYLKT